MDPTGRRVFVQTIGCQMNRHDSARIAEMLRVAGYDMAEDPSAADVWVVNTCSVRDKAEQKARSALGAMVRWKRAGAGRVVVVAGCVAQQLGGRWLEVEPEVDAVVGPDRIAALPGLLRAIEGDGRSRISVGFDGGAPGDFPASRPDVVPPGATAFVTVSKGCDEHCTFCIVPGVRGPLRSRPPGDVVAEVETLARGGVREVTLIGQAVNAWRRGDTDFGTLVRQVGAVPGIERIRYTSPHPRFVDESLVRAHAEVATLCEHVHLPVQSGSDAVLHRMGRGCTRGRYLEIIDHLRSARAGMTFGTDVIVGFPGETESQFEETMSLIRDVRPAQVFSFSYSPRPGTPAARWDDDVPAPEKSRRLSELQRLAEGLARERLASLVGADVEILVEGPSDRGVGSMQGRSRGNDVVHVVGAAGAPVPRAGDLVPVRVDEALPHCVRGTAPGGGGPRVVPRGTAVPP